MSCAALYSDQTPQNLGLEDASKLLYHDADLHLRYPTSEGSWWAHSNLYKSADEGD